jgi:hypothetical protein
MASNLERIKADGYTIEATMNSQRLSVALSGTFDMTAAADLQRFFNDVRAEVLAASPRELEIDVSSVYYLGSSCIKAFVTLTASLKDASKRPALKVITSSRLDWQDRTFSVLARLAPEMVTVERGA